MFTKNLTHAEFSKMRAEDLNTLMSSECRQLKQMRRRVKSVSSIGGRRRLNLHMKEHLFGKNRNEYIVATSYCGKSDSYWGVYFGVVRDSRVEYVMMSSAITMRFSTHFFRRYAERQLKDMSMPTDEVLCKFGTEGLLRIPIWMKDDKVVFAIREGLMLGNVIDINEYAIRTFVSQDMLKDTQADAMASIWPYFEDERLVSCMKSNKRDEFDDIVHGMCVDAISTSLIYNKFYE